MKATSVPIAFRLVRPSRLELAIRKSAFMAFAAGLLFATSAGLAEEKVNMGVSIPAATHGWTGGVVYWANQAKKEL
ncbi:MAG: hypothetical protein WBL40_00260, partial [Terrimicrobiaceae bacterium]